MKRTLFLSAIAGAVAAASLPIPKLPSLVVEAPTYPTVMLWPEYVRMPQVLLVSPKLYDVARELLCSELKALT